MLMQPNHSSVGFFVWDATQTLMDSSSRD